MKILRTASLGSHFTGSYKKRVRPWRWSHILNKTSYFLLLLTQDLECLVGFRKKPRNLENKTLFSFCWHDHFGNFWVFMGRALLLVSVKSKRNSFYWKYFVTIKTRLWGNLWNKLSNMNKFSEACKFIEKRLQFVFFRRVLKIPCVCLGARSMIFTCSPSIQKGESSINHEFFFGILWSVNFRGVFRG